jgi:hypothetical protein
MTRFLVSPSTSKKSAQSPTYCISHPTIAGEGYVLSPRRLSPGTCLIQTHTHTHTKKGNFHLCPPTLPYSRREPSFLFTRKRNWLPSSQSLFWNLLIILLLLPLLLPSFSSAYFSLSTNSVLCTKGSGNLKVCVESKGKKKQVERENGGFVDLWMKTRQIKK